MDIAIKKRNITPSKACFMGGYERKQKSEGVLDEIDMITCIMRFNKELLIFCSLDTICIEKNFRDTLAKHCSDTYQVKNEMFNLSCIHTHSAPAIFSLPTCHEKVEEELKRDVFNHFKQDIAWCMEHLLEVSATCSTVSIEGCYGNRNEKEGSEDKNISMFTFYQQNKPMAMMVNMACHPTILNGSNFLLSSDLLGNVREQLSDYYKVPVILFNGASGDVSTRFYRMSQQSNVVYESAKKITDQLICQIEKPLEMSYVDSCSFSFDTTFDIENDKWTNDEINRIKQNLFINNENNKFEKNLLHRLEMKKEMKKIDCHVSSHAYLFNDTLIITIPGELVSKVGLLMKERYSKYHVILITYCNNYVSYLIDEEDYGKYFESYVAITKKGTVERLMEGLFTQIDKLILNN